MALYGQVVSSNPLNFKNFIINGSMLVWQRGTSLPYNTGGAFFGPADRFWFYSNSGASSGTLERSTDVPSNSGLTYSLFNNTNASYACGTNVELYRQGDYAPFKTGQAYTLSMWVKGTSASSMSLSITWRNAHASGANSVNIDSSKTIPVTTSWVRTSVTFTITANIDPNNLVLDFEWQMPNGCKITGVQLEEGSIVTPFEFRPYSQELQLCQRYYEQVNLSGGQDRPFAAGAAYISGSTLVSQTCLQMKVEKRGIPTATFSAASTFSQHSPGAFRNTLTSIALTNATLTTLQLAGNSGTSGGSVSIQGQAVLLEGSGSGTASIGISAEL